MRRLYLNKSNWLLGKMISTPWENKLSSNKDLPISCGVWALLSAYVRILQLQSLLIKMRLTSNAPVSEKANTGYRGNVAFSISN